MKFDRARNSVKLLLALCVMFGAVGVISNGNGTVLPMYSAVLSLAVAPYRVGEWTWNGTRAVWIPSLQLPQPQSLRRLRFRPLPQKFFLLQLSQQWTVLLKFPFPVLP